MPWKPFLFHEQTVFVRVLPTGKPIIHRDRAEMRYKLGATKSYRASPENLTPIEGEILQDHEFLGTQKDGEKTLREQPVHERTSETIEIYTDGACSGNPGPAGIGIYCLRPTEVVEISEFIGDATNNIAELTAILRALELLQESERNAHIHLYTDSGWSLGVLVGGWKAKTNLQLIAKINEKRALFSHLELLKVQGHAGHPGNEEADRLATMAVRRESSLTRTRKQA